MIIIFKIFFLIVFHYKNMILKKIFIKKKYKKEIFL
jgi:hypothetical protein